jgi:hypothetical protein
VSFDGVLGEPELRCELLVGVAGGDQPEHFNLTLRQLVLTGFSSVGCLRYDLHIGFRVDQRANAFP